MQNKVVKAYLPTLRKYWKSCCVAVLAMVVTVSLRALVPHYLREVVDAVNTDVPDVMLARYNFRMFIGLAVIVLVAHRIFGLGLITHESYAIQDLDNRSFRQLQSQSARFFEDTPSGSLSKCAARFSSAYESIMDLLLMQFAQNVVMVFAMVGMFVLTLPVLAIPLIVWTIIFMTYSIITAWRKYPLDKKNADTDSAVGYAFFDTVSNHFSVKMFGRERSEEKRFANVVHENHCARLRAWHWNEIIMLGQSFIVVAGELLLIGWMIHSWEKGMVTAGDFVFVQMFIIWAVSHLWSFGPNLRRLIAQFANAVEMVDIFQLKPEVTDAAGARNLMVENGEVEFHAVQFGYGGLSSESKGAVHNFDLTVPPGQSIGLVGRSGAGKSTLVKLLLRLYDLDAGYIRIDRQDIANVTQASLRQQLAVVPQSPQLFHRTVRENIAFAAPEASETEVIDAARQACAWDFIQELPDGLDTLVGERGIKLSGGQQQRIVIARAILADPRILILDEATSALDSETEMVIQKAIANLLKGRTAIVIAHRLSTIMQVDKIVVMDEGRIIETGTHDELLDKQGTYANLWSRQSGGYVN